MDITFCTTHDFTKEQLESLFLSVEWSSGHFADKLVIAMKGFKKVISAWDKDKLVGLICVMDDGIMNAYIHYLLVRPEYQKTGIGKELIKRTKDIYKDYLRLVLIAYDKERGFYEHCGFCKMVGDSPMGITSLWT